MAHILSVALELTLLNHKDLGILLDDHLKFHQHTSSTAAKANHILGLIIKSFEFLYPDMLVKLFKTLVRPIIEYGNTIWGPHFILDQRKLENIQRRATRLVVNLQNKSYAEQLQILNLPSLKFRCLRGDLIFMYKLIKITLQQIFHIYSVFPGEVGKL